MISSEDHTNYLLTCETNWSKIISLLYKSEYIFTVSEREVYDVDDMDLHTLQDHKFEPVLLGYSINITGSYNGYTSTQIYQQDTEEIFQSFKKGFILLVDSTGFSVGDRLQFVSKCKYEIEILEQALFKKPKDLVLHNKTLYKKNEPDWEGLFYSEQEHNSVMREVSRFVAVQHSMYKKVNSFMDTSLAFLPGRLQKYSNKTPEDKINLLLSRIESIQLLLVLREIGIISGSTKDNELARFAEANLLYKQKPLTSVKSTISRLKTQDIPSTSSLGILIEKFKNIIA